MYVYALLHKKAINVFRVGCSNGMIPPSPLDPAALKHLRRNIAAIARSPSDVPARNSCLRFGSPSHKFSPRRTEFLGERKSHPRDCARARFAAEKMVYTVTIYGARCYNIYLIKDRYKSIFVVWKIYQIGITVVSAILYRFMYSLGQQNWHEGNNKIGSSFVLYCCLKLNISVVWINNPWTISNWND